MIMNSQQQNGSFLKLKIKEKKLNKDTKDQNQEIPQIRVIKQNFIDYQKNNTMIDDQQKKNYKNIECLQQATSNLYYAMYQINDKRNLQMITFTQFKFDESDSFIVAIRNLIQEKQKFIENLSEQEKNKYSDAIKWTKNIIDQQDNFDDLYLQILEVYKQIKKPYFKEPNNNLLVLHQNQNQYYNKFLFAFCFIQNIKIESDLLVESQSQSQEIDETTINNQNSQQFDNNQKRNLYFNVTSDIQQIDINFWTFYMQDYKESNKLIILYPNTKEQKLKNNTKNEVIIPIFYTNIVRDYQMKMIYKSILDQQIQNFKPDCIYFEYQLSDQFILDLYALEYLIRQLQKSAKLIIHFRISQNQEFSEYQISNNLNCAVMALQGFKHSERKFINEKIYKQMEEWTIEMMKLKEHSNKNINLSLQSELQIIQIKVQNIQNKIFGYQLENDKFRWIQVDNCNINSQHFLFKDTIILYNKLNRDIHYSNYQPKISNNNNQSILSSKINFCNQENLVEPNVLKISNYLIIAYGHTQNNTNNTYVFSDKIWLYDLENNQQNPIIMSRDEEYEEFRLNYYNKVRNSQEIVDRIKWRRGSQICNNNLFKDNNSNFLSFILIGGETLVQKQGENQNPNLIMNIIEVVILNLKNQKFCSYIVNKQLISKFSSLKPQPYQTVLEGKLQNSYFYLVLNGNQTTRLNYYSFPKNPQYLKQSQLLVQTQNSFQLFILPIKPVQDLIIQIEELLDDCKFQYLDEQNSGNNCFIWKLLITRFVLISESLIRHPYCKPFEDKMKKLWQQGIQFTEICFQVTVKLNLQGQEQNPQNFQDSNVEINYDILDLYLNDN